MTGFYNNCILLYCTSFTMVWQTG